MIEPLDLRVKRKLIGGPSASESAGGALTEALRRVDWTAVFVPGDPMLERAFFRGKSRPKPEKHLPYFAFVKSLSEPGCPVCGRIRASLDDWFENLLYESANDRPLRHRFDAENGLCSRHAHRLCASNDGLGAAVIYRNLLELATASLGKGKLPPVNAGKCAACDHERDAAARYVGLVADFLGEEEMRVGFESSSGLCMPHLAAVMRLRADAPEWFVRLHRTRCAELLEILVRYIDCQKLSIEARKAALSFEDEMAWKRLAPLLTGEQT
jgi:hypothetical protein